MNLIPTADETPRQYAASMALQWADEAENHARATQATQDKIDESKRNSSSWGRQLTDDYREDHSRHATRATEAARMAEMWARVATAMPPAPPADPPPLPTPGG